MGLCYFSAFANEASRIGWTQEAVEGGGGGGGTPPLTVFSTFISRKVGEAPFI